jgi:hypothetical protein
MAKPKTPIGQITCGSCGASGQWTNVRTITIPRPIPDNQRGPFTDSPTMREAPLGLRLECIACGVYTYANPDRVQQ